MSGKESTGGQNDAALRPHVHYGSQAHCGNPHAPLFVAPKGHCCSQPWDGPRARVYSMAALLVVTVLLGLAGLKMGALSRSWADIWAALLMSKDSVGETSVAWKVKSGCPWLGSNDVRPNHPNAKASCPG